MATPDFLPQNSTNFTSIRYYTQYDPYYYTVDNRPIQDVETNLQDIRQNGADCGRRAAALVSLDLSAVVSSLFNTPTATRGYTGLGVTQVNSTTVRIQPGAIYEARAISATVTDVITKIAVATKTTDLTVAYPGTTGTSVVYTVEGTFIELDGTTMASSNLPYVDATNPYLPSTLINGELKLSINAGVAAATGSEVPPATTSGKFPLYNLTLANGGSTFTVWAHANAPYLKGLSKSVMPIPLASGGATAAVTNEIETFAFADGSVLGVIVPMTVATESLNIFKPIKLKVTYFASVTGGNASFRLRYNPFATAGLVTASATTTSIDLVPITTATNQVASFTTTLAVIPNTAFSGFVGGNWVSNKEYLNIILERVGTDAGDTNTGTISIIGVTLVQ